MLRWPSGYPIAARLLDGAFILIAAYSACALLSFAIEATRLNDRVNREVDRSSGGLRGIILGLCSVS